MSMKKFIIGSVIFAAGAVFMHIVENCLACGCDEDDGFDDVFDDDDFDDCDCRTKCCDKMKVAKAFEENHIQQAEAEGEAIPGSNDVSE